MDLGECPKVHDLAFRADYENAAKAKDYFYDIEAMEHLQAFISDCDRRTEAAKKRLAETQEELTAEVAEKANAVHALAEEIGKKLAKAEALGEAGEVEESVKLMKEIEELRAKKVQAEHEYRISMPASTYQQQKLRVCEVCSAYLGIHDNDIRLADHFGGKLHLGFMTIRDKLIELEKTAGPRKADLRRNGKYREREDDRHKSRFFVGGRELDRRSRVHRSRSRERKEGGSKGRSSGKRSSKSKSPSRSRSRSKSYSKRRTPSPPPREPREAREPREREYSRGYEREDRRRDDRYHRDNRDYNRRDDRYNNRRGGNDRYRR
ncbi:LUC7L family protein [Megaselia abdita]